MIFSSLYIEVNESDKAGSFILTYYLYNNSARYTLCNDKEKAYDIIKDLSYEDLCSSVSGLLANIKNNVVIYTFNNLDFVRRLTGDKYTIYNLGKHLGVLCSNIFDIFNFYFSSKNILTKIEMIDCIFSYKISKDISDNKSNVGLFLSASTVENKVIVSFCAFVKDNNSSLNKIISDEYIITVDDYLFYNKCKIKQNICYKLARYGISEKSICPIFFSSVESKCFESIFNKIENKQYVIEVLSSINNINLADFNSFIKYIVSTSSSYCKFSKSAVYLFLAFKKLDESLDFNISGNTIMHNSSVYYKDYSSSIDSLSSKAGVRYGIILDCEGSITDGCSELGGIIYAKKDNKLIKLETFSYKKRYVVEGISELIDSYERVTERYIPARGISVLTYGFNDNKMILASISGNSNKGLRKKVQKYFNFIDIRSYVYDYIDYNNISVKDRKLSTVADVLSVKVIRPKHNALNDSKTLFNILSKILESTKEFI